MREQLTFDSSPSRAAASENQNGRKGIAFPAPVPSFPAQLAGEAKSSMQQPDEKEQSKDVPDLPTDLVTKLQVAKNTPKNRAVAIRELYDYIVNKGITGDNKDIKIVFSYDTSNGKGNMAYAQYDSQDGTAKVNLRVYASIFDTDVPVAGMYSTLRHEIIHAAQQTGEPDKESDSNDLYTFSYERESLGKTVYEQLSHPLEEIETYTWELVNADKTGITGHTKYMQATTRDLTKYTNMAIKYLPRASQKTIEQFGGYILKSIEHLKTVPGYGGNELAQGLKEAYEKRKDHFSKKKRKNNQKNSGDEKDAKKLRETKN